MKTCPSWVEEIQEKAMKCRYCGEFLDGRPPEAMVLPGRYWGYEYRSSAKILYWPLIHIAQGLYPHTGRPRVVKEVIKIADIAIGGIAIGGLAQALLAIRGHDIDLEFARLLERWVSDAPMGQ